jgi:hypothetical protein
MSRGRPRRTLGRVDMPSPREFLDRLGEPIYGVTGRGPVTRSDSVGWGGGGGGRINHLSLGFLVGARADEVRVGTRLDAEPEAFLVHRILGNDLNLRVDRRLRFPVTSTVDRTTVHIPVNGHDQVFTAYTCGREALAVAAVEGRWVLVRCRLSRLTRLTLGTQDPAELRRVLARARARRMRREKTVRRSLQL